jgi:hypothetical protein
MRSALAFFATTCFLFAEGERTSPPSGWKEYSPKDKSFAVWLPEKGKHKDREATIFLKGNILKLRVARVEQDGGPAFDAGVLILPLKLRKTPAAELIDVTRDSYVKEVKGKLLEEKEITQMGVSGKEFLVQTGEGLGRLRVFAVGARVYRAEVAGNKEQVESADAKTFLDSYKLPGKGPR